MYFYAFNFIYNILGYFEHVEDTRNLQEKVLNYVLVMARPLIMYQTDHPVYWSPVYLASKVLFFFKLTY